MKKQSLLLFLLLISSFGSAQYAQVRIDNTCEQAYGFVVSLQLDEAVSLLEEEREIHPDNVYTDYLHNYINFVKLFISQDRNMYDSLLNYKSAYFESIERLNDTNRYKKLLSGNMHLQWAIIKIIFGDVLSGAFEFNQAYRLVNQNHETFPEFKLNDLSVAVIHIITGLVPEKYDWLLRLFSMNGDIEQGKRELSDFLYFAKDDRRYRMLYEEALFYAGFIELNIHPEPGRMHMISNSVSQIDDSVLLLKFLEINLRMRTGQNDTALDLFKKIEKVRKSAYPFSYLDYLHGECYLRSLNLTHAQVSYDLFLENFKGESYIKDAWRKKAWAAFLTKDTVSYFNYLNDVIEEGSARLEIDKDALEEAQKWLIPESTLLASRLLFDGGYYPEALQILEFQDTAPFSSEQKVHYVYRLGRIYDELGNHELAKKYYLFTIEKGNGMNTYFAANAALKLAEIYEQNGDLNMSEEYYTICLGMDFEPYKNSISTRAKEGMKRIRKK